jgi:hypothetical protein
MKTPSNTKAPRAVILAVVTLLAAVCLTTTVTLKHNSYVPSFDPEEFRDYRGRSIYLPSFSNRADNTTVWYYYSLDKKRKYQMSNLEDFYWNCYRDAFIHAGVFVYEDYYGSQGVDLQEKLKQGLREFKLQLSSLTDTEYRFIVTLYDRGDIAFQRKFIIPMAQPETEDRALLEDRAFKMIDKSFRTVLKDPDFRAAFFGPQSGLSPSGQGDQS